MLSCECCRHGKRYAESNPVTYGSSAACVLQVDGSEDHVRRCMAVAGLASAVVVLLAVKRKAVRLHERLPLSNQGLHMSDNATCRCCVSCVVCGAGGLWNDVDV